MTPILEFQEIVKRYGRRELLRGATLAVEPGITVLLGPSGAGKSTLLRLAQGVIAPDSGRVRVKGVDPRAGGRMLRETFGFVPDVPDVPSWMTPRELFAFLAPQYPRWNAERVDGLVAELKLALDVRFAHLSRGEAMKAMLVAALAHEPELLLLDEPFSGFDAPTREALLSAFLVSLDVERTAVLLATHDLDVAGRVADRVALLSEGKLDDMGSLESVLQVMGQQTHIPDRLRDLYDEELRKAIVEVLAS